MLQAVSAYKAPLPRFSGTINRAVGLGQGANVTLGAYQEPIEALLGTDTKTAKVFAEFEAVPNMTGSFSIRPHWISKSRPLTFLHPNGGEIPAGQVQPLSLDVTVDDDLKQTQHPRTPSWCFSVQLDDQKQTASTARLGLGAYQGQLYMLGDESEVESTSTRAGSQDHPPRFRLVTPLRADHIAKTLELLVTRVRNLKYYEHPHSVRSEFRVNAFSSPQ